MSIKKAMAAGLILEKQKGQTVELLANTIGENFSLLANIEPYAALEVLSQMSEQFNEEIAEEMIKSRKNAIKNMASKMNISADSLEDDFDDEDED